MRMKAPAAIMNDSRRFSSVWRLTTLAGRRFSSIGQAVTDTIADVKVGRKPISAYTDAVKTWQSQGGNQLRDFYQGIREKYGTGQ